MDIDLEKQRLDMMQNSVVIIIHEWVRKAVITVELESKTTKMFVRNVKDMLKRLEDEYRAACREVVKRLSIQNQVSYDIISVHVGGLLPDFDLLVANAKTSTNNTIAKKIVGV